MDINSKAARRAHHRLRRMALDALPIRSEPTAGYIAKKPVGTIDQFDLVDRVVAAAAPFDDREHRDARLFLVHLLKAANYLNDGSIPVPSKVIKRHLRYLDWRPLEDAGIITVGPYCRFQRRCREFSVSADLRVAFYEAGPTADRVARDGLYNLANGRPTTVRKKSARRTASGNALPPKVRAAIDAVGEVPIDLHAIERHVGQLRAEYEGAEPGPERVSAEGRYLNDLRCLHALFEQGARPLDPECPEGLWVYRPAYRPQRFGRVSQIGGGLQSCSAEMKAVAYPTMFPAAL